MNTEIAATATGLEGNEGRQYIDMYNPIFYYLGWLLMAYFGLYVATVHIGPALFGTRPPSMFYHNNYRSNYRRKRRSVLENPDLAEMTKNVVSAVEKFAM